MTSRVGEFFGEALCKGYNVIRWWGRLGSY